MSSSTSDSASSDVTSLPVSSSELSASISTSSSATSADIAALPPVGVSSPSDPLSDPLSLLPSVDEFSSALEPDASTSSLFLRRLRGRRRRGLASSSSPELVLSVAASDWAGASVDASASGDSAFGVSDASSLSLVRGLRRERERDGFLSFFWLSSPSPILSSTISASLTCALLWAWPCAIASRSATGI